MSLRLVTRRIISPTQLILMFPLREVHRACVVDPALTTQEGSLARP